MYGLEQVHIAVPTDASISSYATGMNYGPKRKMTKNHNTSISAIGILSTPKKNKIVLNVYHNIYAANPLDPALLGGYSIRQYRLEDEESDTTARWVEIEV
jgi:hypothetical protein